MTRLHVPSPKIVTLCKNRLVDAPHPLSVSGTSLACFRGRNRRILSCEFEAQGCHVQVNVLEPTCPSWHDTCRDAGSSWAEGALPAAVRTPSCPKRTPGSRTGSPHHRARSALSPQIFSRLVPNYQQGAWLNPLSHTGQDRELCGLSAVQAARPSIAIILVITYVCERSIKAMPASHPSLLWFACV